MTFTAAALFLSQGPVERRLPVRDGDVGFYAVAALVLLVVGGLLIYLSRRHR